MKNLFRELAWFDRADWGFFIVLSVLDLLMVVLTVVLMLGGAPWYVVVGAGLVTALAIYELVNASQLAISTNKKITQFDSNWER